MDDRENEEEIRRYAFELTDEVKAGAIQSGESPKVQFLRHVKDGLGDTKFLNEPVFFYWNMAICPMQVELCGYDVDEIDNSITLFAVDLGEPCHTVDKAFVDRLCSRASNFVKCSLASNKTLIEALENDASDLNDEIWTLHKSQKGLSRINVVLLTNGVSVTRSRESAGSLKGYDIDEVHVVWDMRWIFQNCHQGMAYDEIVLDFLNDEDLEPLVNKGLPFLAVPQPDPIFDCYQCVVPGRLLSKIYREYGSPLLEGNVRSFLTTKTAVNKQIQSTIMNEPGRFYIYNNGIAAVASDVEIKTVDGAPRIVRISNLQIINGGQTTASLAFAEQKRDYDLENVSVPMKLTVIHSSESEDGEAGLGNLIQKISRTSNSQNKVSDADFFANHPFHTQMKKYSMDLAVPGLSYNTYWFYERARGEYAQSVAFKSALERKNFERLHPKEMYLTKTDFAKFFEILHLHPDVVSKGGVTCFNTFAKYINNEYEEGRSARFNEVFFKEICGVARIYRTVEPLLTSRKQSWFNGSYRANVISYALSLFFYLLSNQCPDSFDLTIVFTHGVNEQLQTQILELCRLAYGILVDDSREVENVTQWAKRQKCWDVMKSRLGETPLSLDDIQAYIRNRAQVDSEKKAAAQDRRIQEDVDVYQKAYDAEHRTLWEPLYLFVEKNRNQFPDYRRAEEIALEHVVKAMKGRIVPSREDCRIALAFLEDARLVGFPY